MRRELLVAGVALLLAGCQGPPPLSETAPPDPVPSAREVLWKRLPSPADLPADRPLRAAFLVVDGVYDTELVAPLDVLEHTVHHTGDRPGIEVFTVSPDGAPVVTAEGLTLAPDHSFADAPPADILVVASAERSRDADLERTALVEWVRVTGEDARWVMSLCWGAFVLAEAGLLDGHAATTFPSSWDDLADRYPEVEVRRGPSFVHHGKVLTSQGGVRSFDVAMYLVDHLYGEEVARRVGAGLLVDWPPAPGALTAEVVAEGS